MLVLCYLIFFVFLKASGVSVTEDVKVRFDEIKKKKNQRYLVFYIKDEKSIAVEKIGIKVVFLCVDFF